jgi:hypothetical protein
MPCHAMPCPHAPLGGHGLKPMAYYSAQRNSQPPPPQLLLPVLCPYCDSSLRSASLQGMHACLTMDHMTRHAPLLHHWCAPLIMAIKSRLKS